MLDEVKFQDYEDLCIISKGAFGCVYKAHHINQPEAIVAIKRCLDTNNFNHHKYLKNEADILSQLQHPNIIKLLDQQFEINQEAFIVEEFAEKGDLFEYAKKGAFAGKEDICRSIFHQLIDGISYCHCQSIAHLDIKIQNLLFDRNFTLKIADFGFSSKYDKKSLYSKFKIGTPGYVAPEIIQKVDYNCELADVFSCGVVLFAMFIGCFPFKSADLNDRIYRYMVNGRNKQFWQIFQSQLSMIIPQDFQDLINGMLAYNPADRFTIQKVQESAWFNDFILSQEKLKLRITEINEQLNL